MWNHPKDPTLATLTAQRLTMREKSLTHINIELGFCPCLEGLLNGRLQ